jgi:hypothetical protein
METTTMEERRRSEEIDAMLAEWRALADDEDIKAAGPLGEALSDLILSLVRAVERLL